MSAPIRQNSEGQNVTAICASCVWFQERQGTAEYPLERPIGYCRRYPPPRYQVKDETTWWPLTFPEDWCGEWESES